MLDASPPRLLQVCAVDFTARHFLMPLMRAQREWGFDVHLACTRGEYAASIEAEGFTLHDVGIERSASPLALWRSYRRLKELIARVGFEAVHLHTPVAALAGRPAARRGGAPIVVYTAHGFYFHEAMPAWKRRMHVGLERWAQRRADFLFTQSGEDAATAVEERISAPDRTLAIGNGVDLTQFRPSLLNEAETAALREEIGLAPGDGPVVMMMGRLVREKGCFEFVEAWRRVWIAFPRARALLVGEALPSDRENVEGRLRARIGELRLTESFRILGRRADVARLMAISDVFVLPSWREGMPRSIIEAMASGLPVVATNIRGCREEVVEGETGFLTTPGESERLGKLLIKLLGAPELRDTMGETARRRAEAHFDENLVIERQEKVYRRLFGEKGRAWPGSGA